MKDVLEGREKNTKDTRDGRDIKEGGRRSILPVNVGGPPKQPWAVPIVGYSNRAEVHANPIVVDEE